MRAGLTGMTEDTHPFHRCRAGAALLLVLVLAGCGDHGSSDSGRTATTPAPTPTGTSTPSQTPPDAGAIPDDFPLAQGLTADGDLTVTTPRRGVKGIGLQHRCWRDAWPGASVDRLVVQQTGPELGVTRELAVYPDAATAAAVGEQVRLDAAHCHRLPATSRGAALDVTSYRDVDTGVAHIEASFSETLAGGQPGGSVFVFTRFGRAILAVEDSGEWIHETAGDGIRHLERADRGVVARMCVFTRAGC
jgi:hypothetical protein